jgi:hypothetical protein
MTVQSIEQWIRREPVLLVGVGLAIVVMMATTFPFHFTPVEIAAVSTITTAITAIVAAILVKPVNVALIHAALVTGLVAAAAFGLHLSPAMIAVAASAGVTVLGYLLREKVSPVAGERLWPGSRPSISRGSRQIISARWMRPRFSCRWAA